MTRAFKLTIAYDGSEFAGWQVQPGQPTIQATLEEALATITRSKVRVIGSGRTDAGVHALGQIASCVLPTWRAASADLRRAINTKLPPTIFVTDVTEAPIDFHAIRDATRKRYRYQIQVGGMHDVFAHRFRWHIRIPLSVDAMRRAAVQITGRHDFACFQAAGAERKSTVRTVHACDLIQLPAVAYGAPDRFVPTVNEADLPPGDGQALLLAIEVEADGFLYNMVRNIVGTLVEVGRGKQSPDWVSGLIAGRDRDAAGPTAPAKGLFLQRVDYGPQVSNRAGFPAC